ncbi:MAG: hypothetical protein ACFFAU_19550 [Candidatus Hodarchaeota archaeon]
MCFYLTSTLPKGTNLEQLRDIFDRFNMDFSPIQNPSVQSQLRPGELYFRTTKDYCDCDTIIGALDSSEAYKKLLHSDKVRRLKKKKWNPEQIDEWIKEKLPIRNPKLNKLTPLERKNKIQRWIDFIHSILESKQVKRIGILKHWYDKGLENEDFNIKQKKIVKVNELNEDLLLNMEEGVLYEFIPIYKY